MKQNMIIWVMTALMTLSTSTTMTAAEQSHRHTPRTTMVDNKSKQQAATDSAEAAKAAQNDATVAYSDTTSTDDEWEDDNQPSAYRMQWESGNDKELEFAERIIDKVGGSITALVAISAIIFVFAPVILLIVILYFINRNRRDRIRLAEKCIEHGQPIPGSEKIVYRDAQCSSKKTTQSTESQTIIFDNDLKAKGVKHIAIGLGLMVCCLSFWHNDFLGGIGFLIACYGGGQLYMARGMKVTDTHNKKEEPATGYSDEDNANRNGNSSQESRSNSQENGDSYTKANGDLIYPEK